MNTPQKATDNKVSDHFYMHVRQRMKYEIYDFSEFDHCLQVFNALGRPFFPVSRDVYDSVCGEIR